ncbi:MAG: hypothetical protein LBV16_04650 [Elusimicrobiota bacterium]|nr:hypothetical protein [Elusimicrobiota bacterium]
MKQLLEEIMKGINELFMSEAHFRSYLSRCLQQSLPQAIVNEEYPYPYKNKTIKVDIRVENGGKEHYIELKYKTKKQATENMHSYHIYKDINRLETISKENGSQNFFIFLTNNERYQKVHKDTDYEQFCLSEQICKGIHKWIKTELCERSEEELQKSYPAIEINNDYKIEWKNFGQSQEQLKNFHYFIIAIDNKA